MLDVPSLILTANICRLQQLEPLVQTSGTFTADLNSGSADDIVHLFHTQVESFLPLQVLANGLDNKLREDLERLKKIRAHRGLRHFWG